MKVAELTGALLDYWTARASGELMPRIQDDECLVRGESFGYISYQSSTDWKLAGPIIEREGIDLTSPDDGAILWWAHCWDDVLQENWMASGETPLIAAMRAYVGKAFAGRVPDEMPA